MSRGPLAFHSQRIEQEKAIKHLGTASISLDVLSFPYSLGLSQANVERLSRSFAIGRGFRPEDFDNRIPAVIEEGLLDELLGAAGLTTDSLHSALPGQHVKLKFPPDSRLECLRGRHRVEAAYQAFPHSDKRWTIDLYPADISRELRHALIDEYTNERRPNDGEFFYKIREFQGVFGTKNRYFEKRWWARLAAVSESTDRKKRLEQLLKHPEFAPAFDSFHSLPALYSGMRLSVINKMICLQCHDLLLSSLKDMRDFWYKVFDEDEKAMRRMSRTDVEALQLAAPGACDAEARILRGRIAAGEILHAFDDAERDQILARLCSETTDRLVPSFFAFFENLKYLKGPADCMKMLVRPKSRQTILEAIESVFNSSTLPSGVCPIQVSRTEFRSARIDPAEQFDLLYRQLWLFAFRNYEDMPRKSKRRLAGPRDAASDERVLFAFASLAHKSGLRSREIQEQLGKDPNREMVLRFLETARKPEQYRYRNTEECIARVSAVLREAELLQDGEDWISLESDEEERPPTRCGKPNYIDQRRDISSMFLDKLHNPGYRRGGPVTSFFVQRSWYMSFFGGDIAIDLGDMADLDESSMTGHHQDPGRFTAVSRDQNSSSRLESQDTAEQKQLDAVQTTLQRLQDSLQNLKVEHQGKIEDVERLQALLAEREEHLKTITENVQRTEGHVQQLQDKEARLERDVAQRETECRDRIRRFDDYIQGQEELIRTHRLTIQDREGLAAAHSEGQKRSAELKTEIDELENKRADKQRCLDDLIANLTQQDNHLRDIQSKADQLKRDELNHLARLEELTTTQKRCQGVVDNLAKEEEESQKRLESSRLAVTKLAKEEEESQKRLESSRLAVTKLAKEEEESHKRLESSRLAVTKLAKEEKEPREETERQQQQQPPRYILSATGLEQAVEEVAGTETKICISFKRQVWNWVTVHELLVDPSDQKQIKVVERVASKYLRKNIGLFGADDRMLTPQNCFERVTSDKSYSIRLRPDWEVKTGYGSTDRVDLAVFDVVKVVSGDDKRRKGNN